jgi:hypothetical protein
MQLQIGRAFLLLFLGLCGVAGWVACDGGNRVDAAEGPAASAASSAAAPSVANQPGFGKIWFQGKAELTSYRLEQARYGEVHPGQAVLIFVTEDFSRSKQVKLDDPASAGGDAEKVLKLNFTKKFDTGIYPYSMMMSVFTPLTAAPGVTRKVTTSSQEWCGHTFTQLNRQDGGYRVEQRSYFESEGDLNTTLPAALLEDEVWTLIRLRPEALPLGSVELLPGTFYQRLRHQPFTPLKAEAKLEAVAGEEGLQAYTLVYEGSVRRLTIRFRKAFPHEIESWEEAYTSGWGAGAKELVTRGVRQKRIWLDYWTRNNLADAELRQKLELQ